ncbi:relaxase MobL [Lysinibacillus sp. MHQ-1]|nr:relaxase MobL [Lysinibacillus sp. MHQ-1]
MFQQAQENGSPLWQDVISFDNTWLQKYGLMDESGQVNEVQMKKYCARCSKRNVKSRKYDG